MDIGMNSLVVEDLKILVLSFIFYLVKYFYFFVNIILIMDF